MVGCKLAVVGRDGEVLATTTVYPHGHVRQRTAATAMVVDCLAKFAVDIIALGDGVGCRDTELFLVDALRQCPQVESFPLPFFFPFL